MKTMYRIAAIVMLLLSMTSSIHAQRLQQQLGRGVVAVRNGSKVLVSWRKLAQEPESAHYNVYVNGAKLNASPLSRTNFATTTSRVANGAQVTVALVVDGVEQAQSTPYIYKTQAWNNVVTRIDFETRVLTPNEYKAKYAWPADLDGDGEYEWVVDRLSTTSIRTRSHKLQAYKTDGTCLWTVDLGPNVNIDAGQNDMVLAYDINCDGKAEVIIRSSDGTRFWDAANDTWGAYVGGAPTGDTDGDHIIDYATQAQRNPPYYISVIDGMTGAEIDHAELHYAEAYDGANRYGRDNRSDYRSDDEYCEYSTMGGHFCICYFDGIHPSLASESMVRDAGGTHHVYFFSFGYDWVNGVPTNFHHEYTWSRNDKRPWPAEFHMVRVCDVDGDGIDEMVPGGYGVNTRKGMVYSAGIGHGDRFRISDIDPDRPGLETFAIQQSDLLGQLIYDAATGEHIKEWYLPSVYDVARGECMDVDASRKGYEIYSFVDRSLLFDCKGNVISNTGTDYPYEGIWWDGDLLREVLGSPGGSGYGSNVIINKYGGEKGNRFLQPSSESGWQVHAGWAVRPLFMGDIMGDWREEVALMVQNDETSTGMVVYSTDLETSYSMYCLQEDPHYRLDCTTRGYYQAPNTGFYLGAGMPYPQLPPVMVADVIAAGSTWSAGSNGFTNYQRTAAATYADGQSVLLDLTAPAQIAVEGNVQPGVVYAMPVKGQTIELTGGGALSGTMDLWKSQQGTLVLGTGVAYTGKTIISEGAIETDADLTTTTLDLRARGTLAGNARVGDVVLEGALNYEGGRFSPGTQVEPFGQITFTKGLDINQPAYFELNVQTEGEVRSDVVRVEGDLSVTKPLVLNIKTADAKLLPGTYQLVHYTGAFKGQDANISVMGLAGLSYNIEVGNGAISLVVKEQREASAGVVWTGAGSAIWDYQTENWLLGDAATDFVAGDAVCFTDDAQRTTVTLNELMPVSRVTVAAAKNYTFSGTEGGFSGEADLIKEGTGTLTVNNTKSTYTGATIVSGGTLTIAELADGGRPSSIGAASDAATNLRIGCATLNVNNPNASTTRALTLTDSATINVNTGAVNLRGRIEGRGSLTKTGAGQLTIGYGGANTWAGGTTLNAGTLAMGAWNTTFGTATSDITANGGTLRVFDNNSTSAVPSLRNRITIPAGKTLTIAAGSRCSIAGTLLGAGTLKISFPYVRGDFSTNTSAYEGTVEVTGGQFRVTTSSGLDLSKGTLRLDAGVYAVHVSGGGSSEQNWTSRIGSLASAAADATLGTGTWNVGYLGKNDTYAGKFTGALNKYGDGTLTLTGASTGTLNIYAGTVVAAGTSAPVTTGALTVRNGGTLAGRGQVQAVSVQGGGTIATAPSTSTVSTLTVNGTLSVARGGIVAVKARNTGTRTTSDAFKVAGRVSLNNPTFAITVLGSNDLAEGSELAVFTGAGTVTVSGTPTITPAVPAAGLKWDVSRLASEGVIAVVADPNAVNAPSVSAEPQAVYDIAGRRVVKPAANGVYVVGGRKSLRHR